MSGYHRILRLGFLSLPLSLLVLVGCHPFSIINTKTKIDTPADAISTTPFRYSLRIAPYVFLADTPLKQDDKMFANLATLRDEVYRELRLTPSSQIVQVYLFETKEKYESYMKAKYPYLPKRRAFFAAWPRAIGDEEDLYVYTYLGDRILLDLRHELTHALLHSVLSDVPLWLDEGIAEYFEVDNQVAGLNLDHLENLQREQGQFHPDLARLEGLKKIEEMTPREYRESWAWVHFMLHKNAHTRQILLTYLSSLRTNPNPGQLRPHLQAAVPNLNEAFLEYVSSLSGKNMATNRN